MNSIVMAAKKAARRLARKAREVIAAPVPISHQDQIQTAMFLNEQPRHVNNKWQGFQGRLPTPGKRRKAAGSKKVPSLRM